MERPAETLTHRKRNRRKDIFVASRFRHCSVQRATGHVPVTFPDTGNYRVTVPYVLQLSLRLALLSPSVPVPSFTLGARLPSLARDPSRVARLVLDLGDLTVNEYASSAEPSAFTNIYERLRT